MMAPVPMSARHLVNELRHSGRPNFRDRGNGRNYRCLDCGTEGLISPAEWSRWNVSLRLAAALAWPAEPVGVAQPATRLHSLIARYGRRSRLRAFGSVIVYCRIKRGTR